MIEVKNLDVLDIDLETGECSLGSIKVAKVFCHGIVITRKQLVWWKAHGIVAPHEFLIRKDPRLGLGISNLYRAKSVEEVDEVEKERRKAARIKYNEGKGKYLDIIRRRSAKIDRIDAEIKSWQSMSVEELKATKRSIRNRKEKERFKAILDVLITEKSGTKQGG
jgi:hypothetical protein